jgi:hypothetical protein
LVSRGSPAKGFLSGANVGLFQAIRPAAFSRTVMLLLMWAAAARVPAKTAGGQPSGSTNPIVAARPWLR